MAQSAGVLLKKKFGQHFLRDYDVLAKIIQHAQLTEADSVLEIGCGDGFLTRALLDEPIKKLCSFEIDQQWATQVKNSIQDDRFELKIQDILTIQNDFFVHDGLWKVVANLPYNITFPILEIFRLQSDYLDRGIIMIQEEVAQKLAKKAGNGKDYGFVSLFYQYYFDFTLLDKVLPASFFPMPNVVSRLIAFRPKKERPAIEDAENFWNFIKLVFKQPRRTLKNNLAESSLKISQLSEEVLQKRAQQLDFQQLLQLWHAIK
ncbi:ribosomal RNA small subunit methyltransferase A [bacterium]|nr:MAG: ribosomal RNA small subunit methyltransferase A [bacterium]QQR61721.1 MAG: ribosomal RNA small subunit methyltransferase A [bacterium]QQR62711.1 MAG: ribosomal RNA small subunit methyltransferase A [bacterium]